LVSIEDVLEVANAESNGHMTDDVTGPYDVIPKTSCNRDIQNASVFRMFLLLEWWLSELDDLLTKWSPMSYV